MDTETKYTIIIEKPHKKVTLVEDFLDFKYIVKEGDAVDIKDEYRAYQRLKKLGLTDFIPEVYYFREEPEGYYKLVIEYIDAVKLNDDFSLIKKRAFWNLLLCQLAYFINILEKNKIQHNDFHLGNVLMKCEKKNKICQVKIIDLETLTDYANKKIFSSMIKNADEKEMTRMGWNLKFHPGSDLNQIIGEILDQYRDYIPKDLYNVLDPLIIKYDKEFPFAISQENPATTGKAIIDLLKCQS